MFYRYVLLSLSCCHLFGNMLLSTVYEKARFHGRTRLSRLFAVVGERPRDLPSIGACNIPIHLGIVNCVLQ